MALQGRCHDDVWRVLPDVLWVAGLATALVTLSVASYQAKLGGVGLLAKLGDAGLQFSLNLGMAAFCLGLLLGSREWWERVAWGLLCVLFAILAVWAGWGAHAGQPASADHPVQESTQPYASRQSRWAGWSLAPTALVVLVGWPIITGVGLLREARSVQGHLSALEQAARGDAGRLAMPDVQAAGRHLAGLHDDLDVIHSRVGPLLPLGRHFRWAPKHGGDSAAADLSRSPFAPERSSGTFQALSPALDLFFAADENLGAEETVEQLLRMLVTAQPALQSTQEDLAAAHEARALLTRASSHRG
jgi:hypothetical protein